MNRRKFVKGLILTAASVPLTGLVKENYLPGIEIIHNPWNENTGPHRYIRPEIVMSKPISIIKVTGSHEYDGVYEITECELLAVKGSFSYDINHEARI